MGRSGPARNGDVSVPGRWERMSFPRELRGGSGQLLCFFERAFTDPRCLGTLIAIHMRMTEVANSVFLSR